MIKNSKLKIGMISIKEESLINSEISEYKSLINCDVHYLLRYMSLGDVFPVKTCSIAREQNCIPVLTLELNDSQKGDARRDSNTNGNSLDDILDGKYDKYFTEFASDIVQYKDEIHIKLLHEFNSNWYVWGGYKNGGIKGGSKKVVRVWQYVVDIFTTQNANNIKWVWCPHEPSVDVSTEEWNDIINYWPGDEYVDLLGIDGFNFFPENPERSNPSFLSFGELFDETYKKMLNISNKPISIMTGSAEFKREGIIDSKSKWIEDAFNSISTKYKNVNTMFWFNFKFNESANWRVDSSDITLDTFKRVLKK